MRAIAITFAFVAVTFGSDAISAQCAAITDPMDRLRCYDEAEAPSKAPSPPPTIGSGITPEGQAVIDSLFGWKVETEVDPLTGKRKYVAVLGGTEDGSKPVRRSLGFRCFDGKYEAMISWDAYLGTRELMYLKMRFDDGEIENVAWNPSGSGGAAFSTKPKDFIDRVRTSSKLVIQASPWKKAATTAVFDVKASVDRLAPLLECAP